MASQLFAPPPLAGDQGSWPAQGQWHYEDYLRLPDDGKRYEIIEGVLYVANAPGYDHQFTVAEITYHFQVFVREHKLGRVLNSPFEVHLSESSRPVQPDILVLTNEQQPPPGASFFDGAPLLIVEVISPSSIRLDRYTKFDVYERSGVAEYWLADPKTRSVEVYVLSNGEYALLGQFTNEELITSNVLAGFSIQTSALFSETIYPQEQPNA
ncbi:MAG: Uma2 family endonuclease [Chloroflexi bacterium]|nr:Uma2 family endonuclease [Chloroflexota bacterium]